MEWLRLWEWMVMVMVAWSMVKPIQCKVVRQNLGVGIVQSRILLLAVDINFEDRSHGSSSDLRWPGQAEVGCGLLQLLYLLCSSP